ncbi:SPOR domain-containing protein [Megalodesulfovibrio paquesii]
MKFDLKKNASSASPSVGMRPGPPPGPGKRYKLEFSRTGLFGFGAVTLLGLVWVFIFGVLVGRGYRPETAVPELARIMPADQGGNKTTADQGVLPPEELEFYDALKKGGNVSPQLPSEPKSVSSAGGAVADASMHPPVEEEDLPPAEVVQDLSKPRPATAVASSAAAPAAAPAASAKHQPAPAAPPAASAAAQTKPAAPKTPTPPQENLSDDDNGPPGQRYAYIYQAAAFNEASKAEAFKAKMHALNLKVSVQKVEDGGKTWHRVMVHFEGKPEDTRQLKEKLKQAGIEKALLRSKKPI